MAVRYPRALSGGQAQRVGVARALALAPDVLLMDEPFGALDPVGRRHIQDAFMKLTQNLGTTTVMVTHDVDEAMKMGTRVAVMDGGGWFRLIRRRCS